MRTFLKGKGKIAHWTESSPDAKDPNFAAWEVEDSLIISWLWGSMHSEVSKSYMFLSMAKEIWDTAKRTYSKVQDASVIFYIKMKISGTKHGPLTVTEYYNKMNGYWLELDHYEHIKMKCSEDTATITAIFETDRVVEFLTGLNANFDQVRVQVLGKDKIPSLNEVFAIVCSEEYRRIAMLNETSLEGSAMATNKKDASWFRSQQGGNVFNPKAQNKDGLWCSFCKKPRHTKKTCFRLHGKKRY